jgi:hypothetical protein
MLPVGTSFEQPCAEKKLDHKFTLDTRSEGHMAGVASPKSPDPKRFVRRGWEKGTATSTR